MDDFKEFKIIMSILLVGLIVFLGIRTYLKSTEKFPKFETDEVVEIVEIDETWFLYRYKDHFIGKKVTIKRIKKNFGDGWLYFWFSMDEKIGEETITMTYWIEKGKGAKVKKVKKQKDSLLGDGRIIQ